MKKIYLIKHLSLSMLIGMSFVFYSQEVNGADITNANDTEEVQVVAKDSLDYSFFNSLKNMREHIMYYAYHLSNGTTKIVDSSENEFTVKTESEIDPYTGESTGKYTSIQDYLPNNYGVIVKEYRILSGELNLTNGYTLHVKNHSCMLSTPLGISYSITLNNNMQGKFYFDWKKLHIFNENIRDWFRSDKTLKIIGINGNELSDMSDTVVDGLDGTFNGAYYDDKTNTMYFVLNRSQTNLGALCQDGYTMKAVSLSGDTKVPVTTEDLKAKKAILINALQSDQISEFTQNANIISIKYENGDYIKISKLQNGAVYDCNIHRPLGIWTVSLTADKQLKSTFTYENGPYKGLIYNADIKYSNFGCCLSIPDMVNHKMMTNQGTDYRCRLYNPKGNRYMSIEDNGDITEYIQAKRAQEQKQQLEEFKKKSQPIYNAYCAKYGKGNVDAILKNGTLRVGMPISVIKALCNCYMTDDWGHIQWYKVMYSGYEYDLTNNSIKTYSTSFGAKVWYIGVTNGTVKYLGRRPY